MCGIAGIVSLEGPRPDVGVLDRMTDALTHRGPNGRGTVVHESVGLGHRRLSVLDLTQAGSQPMTSEDGAYILTFNGEIYNFAEEKKHLEAQGHVFRSRSDTEVLLALYRAYGPACVERLRGMFAFAVHDRTRNILFLARDRIGKKPLLWFRENGVFAFASEINALREHPACPRAVDAEAIHHFLTMMYVAAPSTGFVGVHALPAASTLTLDLATGKETVERYWRLRYDTDEMTTLPAWEERIRSTLEESIKLRMTADVPVGAFLSGGLDSATVVAMMSRLSPHPVQTFSIGSDDEAFNELPQAALIAKAFGTDHHPILLRADIVHLLPELVRAYGQPFADPSSIPTYLVARETAKHVTVALTGDGGDENFAGYARYPIALFSERWRRAPAPLHALARAGTSLLHRLRNDTFSARSKRFEETIDLPFERRYLQYLSFFTEEEKAALYRGDMRGKFPRTDAFYAALTADARSRAEGVLHTAMSMDLDTYLPDDLMPKVDIATMQFGLESRSPFLDHHLLELTARLPARYRLRGRTRKWILRRLVRDLLPPEILRKRKTGFRLPLDRWFRSDLKPFVRDRLLRPDSHLWEYFDRGAMERFLREYERGSVDRSDQVWALLWLDEWLSQYA